MAVVPSGLFRVEAHMDSGKRPSISTPTRAELAPPGAIEDLVAGAVSWDGHRIAPSLRALCLLRVEARLDSGELLSTFVNLGAQLAPPGAIPYPFVGVVSKAIPGTQAGPRRG